MAQLTPRRSPLDRIELLSVVALAIAYAVLSIALAAEWGRIVRVFATDVAPSSDTASALLAQNSGELP